MLISPFLLQTANQFQCAHFACFEFIAILAQQGVVDSLLPRENVPDVLLDCAVRNETVDGHGVLRRGTMRPVVAAHS